VPKRKIKEEKPRKKLGRKEVLIIPIIMGGATLAALLVSQLFPPPDPFQVCLKNHDVETFQLFPRVEMVVDGKPMLLPDGIGKAPNDKGQDCIRPMHTDAVGNTVHIEYIRPIKFSMADFMRLLTYGRSDKTVTLLDNSTGTPEPRMVNLDDYNIQYSYFSEKNEFTKVPSIKDVPPFSKEMVVRAELTHK